MCLQFFNETKCWLKCLDMLEALYVCTLFNIHLTYLQTAQNKQVFSKKIFFRNRQRKQTLLKINIKINYIKFSLYKNVQQYLPFSVVQLDLFHIVSCRWSFVHHNSRTFRFSTAFKLESVSLGVLIWIILKVYLGFSLNSIEIIL